MIQDYFGDGSNLGVNIEYIHEEFPLGTAGSLSMIKNIVDEPLLLQMVTLLLIFDTQIYSNFTNDRISCNDGGTLA